MNSDLKNDIAATKGKSQYDGSVKRLLSQREILAHILIRTIPEFMGMKAKEVMQYIYDGPHLGVPVDGGLTNIEKVKGSRILGLNTECFDIKEGMIRFDILFYVMMKDGITPMLINVEAQKSMPREYDISKRAVFYASRLISSQKGRDFVKSNYNDIRQIYSIWICLNMEKNVLSHIRLTQDDLIGEYNWGSGTKLFNIIFVGATKEIPPESPGFELHRFISSLTDTLLKDSEKFLILEKEYGIDINDEIEREVNTMCNLGEGILEMGIAQGIDKTVEVLNMCNNGCTALQISNATGMELSKIEMILRLIGR